MHFHFHSKTQIDETLFENKTNKHSWALKKLIVFLLFLLFSFSFFYFSRLCFFFARNAVFNDAVCSSIVVLTAMSACPLHDPELDE